ncbi:MAG: class I SAM-dependent DNA methyltransferase [Eggerthellaceae bacterium]|nr:class I SAM-dependent DNA methyltransferase [Eggerthellaceae bacterium]
MRAIWIDCDGKPIKAAGKIDYVSAWYYKASQYMFGQRLCAAFVSTNSICQGDQVAPIWKTLDDLFGTRITFAWKTFVWNSEAANQAHVHVVIVGFTTDRDVAEGQKRLVFDAHSEGRVVSNINGYLSDAPNVFVEPRKKPLSDIPAMQTGNRPADGGHLIIEGEDYQAFVAEEPGAVPFIRPFLGSREFINGLQRWCLWLEGTTQEDIHRLPKVAERVEQCRQDRLAAPDEGRRKLAAQPHLFREQKCSDHPYLVVPSVSSERRHYVPIGYVSAETICSNLVFIVLDGGIYEFAIMSSQMHNAWMRAVAGRLKSDYRYSQDLVYNTFPWPSPAPEQRQRIEDCAQQVLDVRGNYPDKSLADLYDPDKMPSVRRQAHQALDGAVEAAYGVDFGGNEERIVAHLFRLYADAVEREK